MHRIFPPHPGLQSEHCQNRQARQPQPRIAQRRPGQNSQSHERGHRQSETSHSNHWCTGKDSNLRTSQGGTDLQSVGFNHSPTCANFRAFPATNHKSRNQPSYGDYPGSKTDPIEKPGARKLLARKNTTLGKFLMECCWEKSSYATAPRKMPCVPDTKSSLRIRCWSWRRDLNPRPSDYKSDALPTELRQQWDKLALTGRMYPSDPFQMSGTILKGTITVILSATGWFSLSESSP